MWSSRGLTFSTKNRNKLSIETICAISQVDFNFKMDVDEFYDYLLKNDKLIRAIGNSEKYVRRQDENKSDTEE